MTKWNNTDKDLTKQMHQRLSINNNDWHKLKNDPNRRCVELLSGAIVHLVNGGSKASTIDMIEQSLLWLKREVKDPGCPHH
tara:strand:- start:159 stop:401 length:243 start_codon:yes stop_codon:yes gene_type:complete